MMPINVLIVEDEPLIRLSVAMDLEDAGYYVFEADNADTALAVLEQGAVGCLVTDVDMPGSMNGIGLAELTRKQFPEMPIIVMSGHHKLSSTDLPDGSAFLGKPATGEQVARAISRLAS